MSFKLRSIFVLFISIIWLSFSVNPISAAPPVIEKNHNGTFLKINGEPYFPLGFFHVSDSPVSRYGDEYLQDLATLGSNGFNFMGSALNPADADAMALVGAQYGIYIATVVYEPQLEQRITNMIDNPYIIGWYAGDDFEYVKRSATVPNYTPAELAASADRIKAVDPGRLTMGWSTSYPHRELGETDKYQYTLRDYQGTVDLVGAEVYPIDNQSWPFESPLEENIALYDHVRASFPNEVFLGLPQTFDWSWSNTSRYPTKNEIRNFVYGGLISGANGLVGYAYYDDTGLLPVDGPDVWDEMVAFAADAPEFLPTIMNGTRTRYHSLDDAVLYYNPDSIGSNYGKPHVHAGIWETDAEVLVIAINTSQSQALDANINLPASVTSAPQPLFPGNSRYSAGLSFANGALSGSIPAEGVAIYKFTKTGTATPLPTESPSTLPSPSPTACNRADINQDGKVNIFDYTLLINNFFSPTPDPERADINQDGTVNIFDYSLLVGSFFEDSGC